MESALLDGEIVALDRKGRSDFSVLQSALRRSSSTNLYYYVFDLLELDGRDLRALPLFERKELLKKLFVGGRFTHVRYSDHWEGPAEKILAKCCGLGLEGIISKDRNAPYVSGRARQWLKSKCRQGQEAIVVGYTPPKGSRTGFGSLVLAAHSQGPEYRYLGRIGTGFDRKNISDLLRRMKPLRVSSSPFSIRVPLESTIQWLKPKLVAEIEFHGFTADGQIRHGVFRALREDKPEYEVTLERPMKTDEAESTVSLTHPEKVLIPEGSVTKRALRDYLVRVADWILPHLVGRPIAIFRCPDGTRGECFFQKRLMPGRNVGLKAASLKGPNGKTNSVFTLESAVGLETFAQMGVLEIHPWGTHLRHYLTPDLLVFDLDPDESVPWADVAEAALRIRKILERFGLKSFVKVSGNKGLHVHVPIEPTESWEYAKAFATEIALILVREYPERYVATMAKTKRRGKIFIDTFRNGYGNTSIVAYGTRAKNGGAIALPVRWDEIKDVDPRGFRIPDVIDRIDRIKPGGRGDPWRDYLKTVQRLPKLERQSADAHA